VKTRIEHIREYTARNGVSVQITRRADVGPAIIVDGIEIAPLNVAALREYFSQDDDPTSRDICASCGVYRYVHTQARSRCPKFRKANRIQRFLFHHSIIGHIQAWAWWRLTTENFRWRVANRLHNRRPDLCWCYMVEAVLLQGAPNDYSSKYYCGDLCNVPLLSQARPWVEGRCYCSVPTPSDAGSSNG